MKTGYILRCTFIPQAWVNNYAIEVDPRGELIWNTPWEADELPEPFSEESDQLRWTDDAPEWVRDWSGPFEVEYEVVATVGQPFVVPSWLTEERADW